MADTNKELTHQEKIELIKKEITRLDFEILELGKERDKQNKLLEQALLDQFKEDQPDIRIGKDLMYDRYWFSQKKENEQLGRVENLFVIRGKVFAEMVRIKKSGEPGKLFDRIDTSQLHVHSEYQKHID